MIRLAGRLLSLMGALTITLFAMGAVAGSARVDPYPSSADCGVENMCVAYGGIWQGSGGPPPPLPHLLRPHLPRVKVPVIVCEPEPGETQADCDMPRNAG